MAEKTPTLAPAGSASGSTPVRLLALDALRGFDMFWIVGAEDIVHALKRFSDSAVTRFMATQMSHKPWAGMAFYDLIFPMFVFMVGVSLVFSLDRIIQREGKAAAVGRILRRGLVLYILGIFYYGGFATPFDRIRLLGVLQRIALAYTFAGLTYCFFELRGRITVFATVLLGYWALMCFVPVPGGTAGDFAEGKNLANWLDREYLPFRKWDGDHDPEGMLSTLPAIGTCLLGVFAGMVLKDGRVPAPKKVVWLLLGGVGLVAAGWIWNLQFPVIKKLWTSSYVLVAGGYSCLLLAAFYQVIDVWHVQAWAQPFVWIGMNPIAIYMIHNLVDLKAIAQRFVGGDVAHMFGKADELVLTMVILALSFWICRFLYRRKIFLRV